MKFNCECCGYATQNKSNFQRHTRTKKHQRNIGLCVENLHECFKAEQAEEWFEDPVNTVVVSWDIDNKLLDEMMEEEEEVMDIDTKKNCMWVEQVKKQANWERGKRININLKSNCEGCFYVFIVNDDDYTNYQYISEDGLLMTKTLENLRKWRTCKDMKEEFDTYVECDCVYNDNVRYELEVEENGGFIMK